MAWHAYDEVRSPSVFARRYDASGAPLDPQEFLVNAYTTDGQSWAQVAALADGGFVVVWTDGVQDGRSFGVFGRRFDADGAAGPEFRVNTYTTGRQMEPAVSADAAGTFVVAWQSYGQAGDNYAVYAQRYDAAGAPAGSEFRVNTNVNGEHWFPSAAMDAAGNFVVAWQGLYSGRYHIFARRYDTSGTPAGKEFRVNTSAPGDLGYASVAAASGGDFVVAWRSTLSNGGTSESVFAQRFDSKGAPLGREFRMHAYTTDAQWNPAVTVDAVGNFVLAWTSRALDGSHHDVFARVFDRLGEAVGDEFRVNSYTTSQQGARAVVFGAAGRFVTIWQSYGQDGSSDGIFGQRFVADPIFRDGFEAGNVDAWSDAGGAGLTVTAAAGMGGSSLGVAALVDDTTALFVTDEFPAGEVRYRARFYVDPNGFDPGEAHGRHRTRTFVAFAENPTRRVAAIVLRRIGGAYGLMGRVLRDDGTRADTGFFPIADGAHAIEIDLVAATGPDALDGTLELWVDGVSQLQLTGLDNSEGIVDFVRMGALSVKPGAAGTLYFDEFESRRASYIGPLP